VGLIIGNYRDGYLVRDILSRAPRSENPGALMMQNRFNSPVERKDRFGKVLFIFARHSDRALRMSRREDQRAQVSLHVFL